MVEALQSARARKALGDWREFLLVLERGAAGDRQAAHPIGGLAAARIAKVYLKMVRTGGAIDDSSPAEALHELRKTGKELRYLLEFFQGIFPASRVKPMVRALKALQDTLGRFQDRQVQGELIRSLREEVKTLPGGADALMAMGRLIARLEEEQRQAREDFEGRFAAFASPRQQQLVRETFA
jgi:CHAD domain-containing protein